MFHTILTLSYTIPGIYLFFRIWSLFIPKKHLWSYLPVFAMMYSVYPLSQSLEDSMNPVSILLGNISNYLLPFFLYLFLLLLITDIFLLINRISGVLNKNLIRRIVYTYRYFSILTALSILIVVAGIINFNTIRSTTYHLKIPAGGSNIDNLRVAFVSDFHLERSVSGKFVQRFVKKISSIKPDILLYGGDIVEGNGDNLGDFELMLRSIRTRYGVYGALGNHDRISNFRDNFFTRSGIVLLRDSTVMINNAFMLAGRKLGRNSREDASEIVSGSTYLPVILLDHIPTDFNNISSTKTDLVFSGHTHAGQLFPINLYLKHVYELSHGHMQKGNTHFIVSSGIRLWGPRVRTVGKSEIVVAEIEFVQN